MRPEPGRGMTGAACCGWGRGSEAVPDQVPAEPSFMVEKSEGSFLAPLMWRLKPTQTSRCNPA